MIRKVLTFLILVFGVVTATARASPVNVDFNSTGLTGGTLTYLGDTFSLSGVPDETLGLDDSSLWSGITITSNNAAFFVNSADKTCPAPAGVSKCRTGVLTYMITLGNVTQAVSQNFLWFVGTTLTPYDQFSAQASGPIEFDTSQGVFDVVLNAFQSGQDGVLGATDKFATTATITAVPEPSSLATILGTGLVGLTLRFRRRRA
jgi:hypothetical protein